MATFDGVVIEDSNKVARIKLDGADGSIVSRSTAWVAVFLINSNTGELTLQGVNAPGHSMPRIRLEPAGANIWLGGNSQDGSLLFFRKAGYKKTINDSTIYIEGGNGQMRLGGNGTHGDLALFPSGVVGADLKNRDNATIRLDGNTGDIILSNADCAEDFDLEDPSLEPGSVLVLDDKPGRLRVSDAPYDTRVAGILSGAGDYRPALVLDRKPEREGRRPVALAGKVWCKAEARSTPIGVGSLLTTSSLPGHAMAATDRERAFGAVLGKALAPLEAGVGVVPVLVALQ